MMENEVTQFNNALRVVNQDRDIQSLSMKLAAERAENTRLAARAKELEEAIAVDKEIAKGSK